MKKIKNIISLAFSICFTLVTLAQTNSSTPNGFASFDEFKNSLPTLTLNFQLKKRTKGNVFMTGGIENYRIENVDTKVNKDGAEKVIWGVRQNDSAYINSYPYSKIKGYNLIIEKGYYTYFIGEPARTKNEQEKLGIINPVEKQMAVCCQAGYVILPDGTIKFLKPDVLTDLCKDNEELVKEIITANLQLKDVYEMFDFLKKYNATKNNHVINYAAIKLYSTRE